MKIKYTKKWLKMNLIMGLIWLVFGCIQLIYSDFKNWLDFGWIVIALLYLINYSYEYFNHYLTIENGMVKMNKPFGKKMKLTEIEQIKKFAGDYIIKSDKTEMIINTQIIDSVSFIELNAVFETLNIK